MGNKNEKKIKLFLFFSLFLFWSCKTTGSIILDNGNGIAEARNHLSELEDQQRKDRTEVERIESELEKIESGITSADEQRERDYTDIITELANGTGNFSEFEAVLRQIRERNDFLPESVN